MHWQLLRARVCVRVQYSQQRHSCTTMWRPPKVYQSVKSRFTGRHRRLPLKPVSPDLQLHVNVSAFSLWLSYWHTCARSHDECVLRPTSEDVYYSVWMNLKRCQHALQPRILSINQFVPWPMLKAPLPSVLESNTIDIAEYFLSSQIENKKRCLAVWRPLDTEATRTGFDFTCELMSSECQREWHKISNISDIR